MSGCKPYKVICIPAREKSTAKTLRFDTHLVYLKNKIGTGVTASVSHGKGVRDKGQIQAGATSCRTLYFLLSAAGSQWRILSRGVTFMF